mgnify:CR=1 FL=1
MQPMTHRGMMRDPMQNVSRKKTEHVLPEGSADVLRDVFRDTELDTSRDELQEGCFLRNFRRHDVLERLEALRNVPQEVVRDVLPDVARKVSRETRLDEFQDLSGEAPRDVFREMCSSRNFLSE